MTTSAHGDIAKHTYRSLALVIPFVISFRHVTLLTGLRHTFAVRSRSEFSTTEIDEALIAKAANIGLIRMPKKGKSTPAAIGTPAVL